MAEGGGVDKLSLDNELSDSILDEDDDDGRIDEELLEYFANPDTSQETKGRETCGGLIQGWQKLVPFRFLMV